MPHAHGGAKLYHLGWRINGDSFDVALAVNRVLAAGGRAWRLHSTSNQLDAGDYLIELTASQRTAVAGLGLKSTPWEGITRCACCDWALTTGRAMARRFRTAH